MIRGHWNPRRLRFRGPEAIAIRGDFRFRCRCNPRPLESEAMGIQSAPIRIRWGSDWALQEMERCSFALDAMEEAHRRAVMDATEAWNQVADEREAKEVLFEEVD